MEEEKKGLAVEPLENLTEDDFDSSIEVSDNVVSETLKDIYEYEQETGKHVSIPAEDYDPNEEFQKEVEYTEECGKEYATEILSTILDAEEWAKEKSKELDEIFDAPKEQTVDEQK